VSAEAPPPTTRLLQATGVGLAVTCTAAAAAHLAGLGEGGAFAAAGVGVLTTSGMTWWWLARPLEQSLRDLLEVARTGVGAVPSDDAFGAVRDAIGQREQEHARAVTSLRQERQGAWEALDTSPLAILLVDGEGRIQWVNQSFGRLLRSRGDPVGRRPLEVVSVMELHEVVEDILEQGRPAERTAVTQTHDLSISGNTLPNGMIVVRIEDITQAREAERSRTDFVANVSHELRTPVASILGYLDLALADRERIPEDIVPLLETALRNGRRLRDLFEDLLRLHRIEARRRELPLTRQPLAALISNAVGAVRDKAAMRDQQVVVDCPLGLEARINPEALGQILSNLAANASAYSPEGTTVLVRAVPEHEGARVDVIDQGIGIAPRHQERIFERFFRVDEARSRTAGGTGLGLAIVKHFAKASGCRVTLVSTEGAGSTFSVHLPG
jgi:two-component system phosphate regulon sensor histidine kinase PhoR